jgi:hypothetical protein
MTFYCNFLLLLSGPLDPARGLHPRGKILVKILLSNLLPRRLLGVCRACCARVYMCALLMYWCFQMAKFSAEKHNGDG